jgi:hypothetical protein
MTIADDTVQHPSLFRRIHDILEDHPDAGAIVFSQKRNGHEFILQASPHSMCPGSVCGGQIVWKREFIGDNRWDFNTYGTVCDGVFIQAMYNSAPNKFVFADEPLMYFGSLEW